MFFLFLCFILQSLLFENVAEGGGGGGVTPKKKKRRFVVSIRGGGGGGGGGRRLLPYKRHGCLLSHSGGYKLLILV